MNTPAAYFVFMVLALLVTWWAASRVTMRQATARVRERERAIYGASIHGPDWHGIVNGLRQAQELLGGWEPLERRHR